MSPEDWAERVIEWIMLATFGVLSLLVLLGSVAVFVWVVGVVIGEVI